MSDEHLRNLTLVGYALASSTDLLKTSPLPERIAKYCKKWDFNLIFVQKEPGQSTTITRPGLWTVTRALVCYNCPPRTMPMGIDTETWLAEALEPCRCGNPASVDGLVVGDINSISSTARNGAKYSLYLARLGKHLIITEEDRCVSCCNPAVQPILHNF